MSPALSFVRHTFGSLDSDEAVYVAPADNPEAGRAFTSIGDIEAYIQTIKDRGALCSSGTFAAGKPRRKEDLRLIVVISLDSDFKDALQASGMDEEAAKKRVYEGSPSYIAKLRAKHRDTILSTLEAIGLSPSCVVYSGGGHQVHLNVDLEDQQSIEQLRNVQKELIARLNAIVGFPLFDPQASDAGTRYFRVPGTFNTKYAPPRLAEVSQNGGPTYTIEQLKEAANVQLEEEPRTEEETTDADDLIALCELLQPYWKRGMRHELAVSLAGYLLKAGKPEEEVSALLALLAQRTGDEEFRSRLKDIESTYSRLAKGEEVKGYTALAKILTAFDMQRLEDLVRAEEIPFEESPTEAHPVLDEAALYGLAGDIVNAIDPYTEAHKASTLINTLIGVGNCIGAGPHAKVQHDEHSGRLNTVCVGRSGKGRKGTGWSTPRELLRRVDPDWAKNCIKSGLSSGEGLIYNVRDPLWKSEPIKDKGRIVDYQQVLVDEGVKDKRLLVVEPEFASCLTAMAREGNILSEVVRQAWDNGNLSPLTRNNPIVATGAHISIIGHITQDELLARLDDTSKANGFCNRFLFLLVKRSKELPEGGAVPDDILNALAERLKKVIEFARKTTEMKRDEAAKKLWAEIYHDLSEGKPGLLGAVISRAEAQVLRLSIIYALLDLSSVVRTEHLLAALAVWQYCEESAIAIFGKRLGDPTADRILEALRNTPRGLTDSDIHHKLFGGHKSANERARALTLLQSLGLIVAEKETTAGRPRILWRAAQKAH